MSWKRTTVNRVSILLTLSFYSFKRTDFWSLIPSVTSMMYHVCRCQRFQFPALSVQFKVLPFDMPNLFVFKIYCVCHLVRVSCIALSTCPSRSRDITLKSDLSSALLVWITSHWIDVATWACDAIFRTFGRVFLLSAAVSSSTSLSVIFLLPSLPEKCCRGWDGGTRIHQNCGFMNTCHGLMSGNAHANAKDIHLMTFNYRRSWQTTTSSKLFSGKGQKKHCDCIEFNH